MPSAELKGIDKRASDTTQWYAEYYRRKGENRNDVFNPEALFQFLASDKCYIEAFRDVDRKAAILDVGGGSGMGILNLIKYGFPPSHLTIVDIQPDRVAKARLMLAPSVRVVECDATSMTQFGDGQFDVVTASTMFIQMVDADMAQKIASEMLRALKPGGKILIFDWRYDFWRAGYLACDTKRIQKLFDVGRATTLDKKVKGQIVPPLGRFLSKHCGSLYFLVQKIPFLTGLFCYSLTKK
jgi:ubiquinone/menaquinone biosynthesis C-methylase UbiE